jgi:hypothetical protein
MKILIRIIQAIVGILFIVSGLVKANDPLGLAYKMEEYFELWNAGLLAGDSFLKAPLTGLFDFLHAHSKGLSVFMITLEIGAGVALLLAWKKTFILYLVLGLILFFTFLTGYAYLSGKFTNCGCFGDCLPITPFTSFVKDLVLLVMIIALIVGKRFMQPLFTSGTRILMLVASMVLVLALQWYVLNYLPLADCLPFKKGNNISQQMQPPAGSVMDSTAIRYIYEKNGKRFEWAPEQLPADFDTYTYIDRIDKLVRKGNAQPPIKGFILKGESDVDSASIILEQPRVVLIFCMDLEGDNDWVNELSGKTYPVPAFVVTSTPYARAIEILKKKKVTLPLFTCDNTVVKTAARTNPTIYYLEKGTVIRKWGAKEIRDSFEHFTKQ